MKINLEDFVDKKVKVTLRNLSEREGTVKCIYVEDYRKIFFIQASHYALVDFDREGNNNYDSKLNIIHIKELTMNTKEILNEINKTQIQLNKLQKQLKQAFNSEFFTPIEDDSAYKYCLKLIKTKDIQYISGGFDWDKTPQGIRYWDQIRTEYKSLDKSDIQQIKDWVINYLIQKENI